jgi:hypothetical protein
MCSVPQVCGVQPCSVPCGFLGFGFPFVFLDFVLLLGVLLYTFGVLRRLTLFLYKILDYLSKKFLHANFIWNK